MINNADNQKEVLVIDDNDMARSLIETILESEGFTVRNCTDGLSALALANERRFSAYVIDYHLPHVKGDILTAVFRKLHPAAIIIGCSIAPRERTFLSAGADHFILKEKLASQLLPALAPALSPSDCGPRDVASSPCPSS